MLIYYNLERSKYIKRKGLFDIHLPKGQETESKPLNFSRPIIQTTSLLCMHKEEGFEKGFRDHIFGLSTL